MTDVFISYPHQAVKEASQLANALQAKGLKTWYAKEELTPESDWKTVIPRAMKDAPAVAFLVVPHLRPSPWMQEEYMIALQSSWEDKKKILIPVLIGDSETPSFLGRWRALKITKNADFKKVAKQILQLLSSPESSRTEPSKRLKDERSQRLRNIGACQRV